MGGAHVARAPPAGLAEGVEAPVVTDPEAGVGLDVVPGMLAEAGPPVEEPGEAGHHGGHRLPPGLAVERQRRLQRLAGLGRRRRQHGLR